ncbi:SDR family oxidoreductase [Paractinoplanes rishiriensis]|uniref:Short chain dehydrogenase n=1 Tax=Paractinoplanes rishiriensis TaxID=1050105 RepID=A0A919MNU4_9ACTN|nr:SDR family oxidoreductase [Actinoplanes rishiriensis]GIE94401.1 short chain dehydrogenase [Actinoplanes rishiriensis]
MEGGDFAGRVVVVTGGTRGIGAAIARAFAGAGAQVVVCGRQPPADEGGVAFFRADVRDPAQAAALVDAAVERFGRVDVLVNNAGGSPEVAACDASPRLHAKVVELNLIAPLHVSQAANAVMQRQPEGGVILMIGSVSGTRPSPGTAAYGAAKAGLHHLATTLAVEWAPKVRVNSVVPGPVGAAIDPGLIARTVPLARAATPADVAAACLFLASDGAGYISGAALHVHGGGERPPYLS